MSAHPTRVIVNVALAFLLVVVPIAGVWIVVRLANAHVVPASAQDVRASVPISERGIDVTASANLVVTQTVPTSLAPAPQVGTVTAVYVGGGDVIHVGTQLFAIDGVSRVAYHPDSGATLFRDLCRGATGADVRALQILLAAMKLYTGRLDGDFGPATEASVERFNGRIGGAHRDGCFHVQTVVPVRQDGLEIADVSLAVGAYASVDATWVTWRPQVQSVAIGLDSLTPIPDGEYTVRVSGRPFAVTVRDGAASATDPQSFAGLLADDGETTLKGTLRADQPVAAQLVPASAIAVAVDGSMCLRLAQPDGTVEYAPVSPLPVGFGDEVALTPDPALEGRSAVLGSAGDAPVATCR